MGYFDEIREIMDGIREAKQDRIEQGIYQAMYETTTIIAKQENLTYEQVLECYEQDPEFSYCRKWQYGFFYMVSDPLHMKKHYKEFLGTLTEDEKKIHQEQVDKGLIKEMPKIMMQKVKEMWRGGKEKISKRELDIIIRETSKELEDIDLDPEIAENRKIAINKNDTCQDAIKTLK